MTLYLCTKRPQEKTKYFILLIMNAWLTLRQVWNVNQSFDIAFDKDLTRLKGNFGTSKVTFHGNLAALINVKGVSPLIVIKEGYFRN